MSRYILDTSALLCYLRDEKGADQVYKILKNDCSMHRVNLGELYYNVLKKDGEEKAAKIYSLILQYPIQFSDDLTNHFLATVGRFKVYYKMGYADSYAATSTLFEEGILVTKDHDFKILEKEKIIRVLWV